MQKPIQTAGEICPFHRKDVSKVCHKCPLYLHIRGRNVNTGSDIDHWGCAFAFGPALMIENTQMQRETGAAVESLRNIAASQTALTPRESVQLVARGPIPSRAQIARCTDSPDAA